MTQNIYCSAFAVTVRRDYGSMEAWTRSSFESPRTGENQCVAEKWASDWWERCTCRSRRLAANSTTPAPLRPTAATENLMGAQVGSRESQPDENPTIPASGRDRGPISPAR